MAKINLLEIVKETLPNFDASNANDVIKAEKILKLHQKNDKTLSINEIEEFLNFYKENGNKYHDFLEDENIRKLLNDEDFNINSSEIKIHNFSENLHHDFANDYAELILNYIQRNIKNNNWSNLRVFYKNYSSIIDYENTEILIEQITQKNNLVRGVIPYPEQYNLLLDSYRHSINPDFYALQSDVDSAYFNEEILYINNDLANHQHTTNQNKVYLGKIFIALSKFDAYTDELKRLLEKNSKIGAKWINQYKTKEYKPSAINKDYGKTAEWLALSVLIFILGLILYFLYSKLGSFFWLLLFYEMILYLLLNKTLNNHYEKNSETKGDTSFRGKIKKNTFKIFLLQIYVIIIGFAISILGIIIGITIATNGVGLAPILIVGWIIKWIFSKKKQ